MSVKVKVKTTLKVPPFAQVVDKDLIRDLQNDVVSEVILPMIEGGQSPVRAKGRFVKYKDPDKYPGTKKGQRPVNLTLTGKMLEHYKAFIVGRNAKIGIPDNAPQDIRDRALGNNYGMVGIPERRFIPAEGETFKVSVIVALRDVFSKAIGRLLKK